MISLNVTHSPTRGGGGVTMTHTLRTPVLLVNHWVFSHRIPDTSSNLTHPNQAFQATNTYSFVILLDLLRPFRDWR